MYELILFVSSDVDKHSHIVETLNSVFEGTGEGSYSLEIINVMLNPEKAYEYKILATPTLHRAKPLPEKRVIGDMSDPSRMKIILDGIDAH